MNKAVFLDRDGTINVDTGYVHKIKDLKFERRAIKGLKEMQNLGYLLIIITNQSGIGRGLYAEDQYHKFMDYMYRQLEMDGIKIDRDYFCPHHAKEGRGKYKTDCDCRKPKIGMLDQAVGDFDINISSSWVIGDKTADIEMGIRAGCRTILVKTGKGGKDGEYKVAPDHVASNLADAAGYILQNESKN